VSSQERLASRYPNSQSSCELDTNALPATTCPNCGAVVDTPFCGYCGRLLRDDLPLAANPRAFVREGAVEALGLDRRLLATARDTLLRPAEVIRAHLEGRGSGYLHPLKFFLLLAGLYMLVLTWLQPFSFFAIADASDARGLSLTRLVLGADNAQELQAVFARHGLSESDANARFEGRMNTTTPVVSALSLVPLAFVLGVLWRGRPWRDHAMFLLVTWNAIWLVSLVAVPLLRFNTTVALISEYAGTYVYLVVSFLTFYGYRPVAPAVARLVAFVVAEVAVSTVVSALLSAAIMATLFVP
jgi:hypothetical protein